METQLYLQKLGLTGYQAKALGYLIEEGENGAMELMR